MKNLKKLLILILISALLVSTLTACGSTEDETTNGNNVTDEENATDGEDEENTDEETALDAEQKYIFSSGSDITGINPMINTTGPDNGVQDFILETLVAGVTDENYNSIIKPAAAESWDISEDGTV